jgi:hypothetical protein
VTETYHLKRSNDSGHLFRTASGHLRNQWLVLALGATHHNDYGWDDHDTLAYEWNNDDPPALVPMDPWPYLEWDDLWDDVWADLADGTDQTIGGTVPDAGFSWFCQQLGNYWNGQYTEYETTEGVLEAGGKSFGFLTGPLKDKTLSSVKLTLQYTVTGASAWTGLTYELRIKGSAFTFGLDTANGEGTQNTTWAENTDGQVTKEITLAADDLNRADTDSETHFLIAPVYTKPAFPGPVAPVNQGLDVLAGLQNLSARLTYTI